MRWSVYYLKEADKDYQELDGSQRILVDKAIEKVRVNPLPQREGGFGKELCHKNTSDLAGLLKIKLRNAGIRIVYKLIKTGETRGIRGETRGDEVVWNGKSTGSNALVYVATSALLLFSDFAIRSKRDRDIFQDD